MAPKKAELVEKLREMGEEVPSSWTIPQIRARMAEVKESTKGDPDRTLKGKLQKLHQAARNKGILMEHLKDLGIPVNPNKTIAQMVSQGEEEIHSLFEPDSSEMVGFGKFGNLTYQQVWDEQMSYISWVLTTNQESDNPHWRLRRLARWAQQEKHQTATKTKMSPAKASTHTTKNEGYNTKKAESSAGSFSLVSSADASQIKKELEEVEQLRQILQKKMEAVQDQEEALEMEKLEMSHTEGRHKNRKEM